MKEYKKYGYADMVWNPLTGCSANCSVNGKPYCWARPYAHRLKAMGVPAYQMDDPFAPTFHPERLSEPAKWRKPQVVACNFMGDWMDEGHMEKETDWFYDYILDVLLAMCLNKEHVFLTLTKRPKNLLNLVSYFENYSNGITLNNIWWGASVTGPDDLWRIEHLLQAPGKHWLSIEPCLGDVDLASPYTRELYYGLGGGKHDRKHEYDLPGIDQVIIGAQSGPNPTIMQLDWARDIVRQCRDAGVPVFVKQLHINGKLSKDPEEWPEDLRVQQLAWDNNNAVGE